MSTATHCPYCALQCAMTLTPVAASVPVEVSGRDFPTNRGGLCKKGWTSAELLASPDRLTTPLRRDADGELRPIEWDAALDLLADRAAPASAASTAPMRSGYSEAADSPTRRRISSGSSPASRSAPPASTTTDASACRPPLPPRIARSASIAGLPFPLTDLDTADTVLLLGSNVGDTMPPFLSHLQSARAAGGLIVVDPRRSTTARLTDEGAGIHVQPVPGTDLALLLGLAHVVLAERLHDAAYLDERTVGLAALRRSVSPWWPERTQSVTGVPAATIRAARAPARRRPLGRTS